MRDFKSWLKDEFNEEMPEVANYTWFKERNLPMVVECCGCGMSMALPSALIDYNGECYCHSCGE